MAEDVCWMKFVPESEASGQQAEIYDALRRADGSVHNLYKAFSCYPQATISADRLFKDVMHDPTAPLPPWEPELLSIVVARLAGCRYALTHHGANFIELFTEAEGERTRAEAMRAAVEARDWEASVFGPRQRVLIAFAVKLSEHPGAVGEADIDALRNAGFDDAEISQCVQVVANFAYWVRVINSFVIQVASEKVGKY